jgi:hypothetical protein
MVSSSDHLARMVFRNGDANVARMEMSEDLFPNAITQTVCPGGGGAGWLANVIHVPRWRFMRHLSGIREMYGRRGTAIHMGSIAPPTESLGSYLMV